MKSFLVLAFSLLLNSAYSYVVLVDPGHGGEELGAITHTWETKNGEKKTKDLLVLDGCMDGYTNYLCRRL